MGTATDQPREGVPRIHPTAVISEGAQIGPGVKIGPFSYITEQVVIGRDTQVGAHSVIEGPTVIGERNQIFGQCSIGREPQDLKFDGEVSHVIIGDENRIREFTTIHRGTAGGVGNTVLGSRTLIMTGVHIAHDCVVKDGAILGNSATLAGHVEIGDQANIGAFSGVHQFCRVGPHAFIGGYSVVTRDALPFVKTIGTRSQASIFGINGIGLKRRGFSAERIAALKEAYRLLFLRGLRLEEALSRLGQSDPTPDVALLINFIQTCERGFVRSSPRKLAEESVD